MNNRKKGFLKAITALMLVLSFILSLFSDLFRSDSAIMASAYVSGVQGPVKNGSPMLIAKRDYYDDMVSRMYDEGFYQPAFNQNSQNVLNKGIGSEWACAGFVGALMHYVLQGDLKVINDFDTWGTAKNDSFFGTSSGVSNAYGHGSPSHLIYYFGSYNPKFSFNTAANTPITPSQQASYKINGSTTWKSSEWELADYYFSAIGTSTEGLAVYNKLVDAYNNGRIAAGDVIFFYRYDTTKSFASQPDLLPHVGIIGDETTTYNIQKIKDYLGSSYRSDVAIKSINGAVSNANEPTVLTVLNITTGQEWYNAVVGGTSSPKYSHVNYANAAAFFDKNFYTAKEKYTGSADYGDKYSTGYIVYRHSDKSYVSVRAQKSYQTLNGTDLSAAFDNVYKKAGAIYDVFSSYGPQGTNTSIATMTTNSAGYGIFSLTTYGRSVGFELETSTYQNDTLGHIPSGTSIYFKETANSAGYRLNTAAMAGTRINSSMQLVTFTQAATLNESPKSGAIHLEKVLEEGDSSDSDIRSGIFDGAKFEVYYTQYAIENLRNGLSISTDASNGTRTVLINSGNSTSSVSGGGKAYADIIHKIGAFSVENGRVTAESYSIISNQRSYKATATTANAPYDQYLTNLPIGKYCIVEVKAPDDPRVGLSSSVAYYKEFLNSAADDRNVATTFDYTFKVSESIINPSKDPIYLTIVKKDAGPNSEYYNTLEGTEFTLNYFYDSIFDSFEDIDREPDVKLVYAVKKVGEFYILDLTDPRTVVEGEYELDPLINAIVFPKGSYTIEETKAAEGYILGNEPIVLDDHEFGTKILGRLIDDPDYEGELIEQGLTSDGEWINIGVVGIASEAIAPNRANTGELKFIKENDKGDRLSNVSFRLSCNNNDLEWIIYTNENGEYDSARTELKETLRAGNYTLSELPCDANKGYQLLHDISFSIISGESTVIDLGTLIDYEDISIKTRAFSKNSKSKLLSSAGPVVITDSISLHNLDSEAKYTIMGILMEVGETITPLYDPKGNIIIASKPIQTGSASEGVKVDINEELDFPELQGTLLKGKTVVIYEYLYEGTAGDELSFSNGNIACGNVLAKHEDQNDKDQTVYFPEISTSVGSHQYTASKELTITDTVRYSKLLPDSEYTLHAVLIDALTGELIARPEKTSCFKTAQGGDLASGTQDVSITFDASQYADKTIVVYEYLYEGNHENAALLENLNPLAVHTESSDKDQSFTLLVPLSIEKTDDKDRIIGGAKMEIRNENNEVVDSWISVEGQSHDIKLPTGHYTLIETRSPKGLTLADPIEFDIKPDMSIVKDNEKAENSLIDLYDTAASRLPDTGGVGKDIYHFTGFFLLCVLLYFGLKSGKARKIRQHEE